MLYASKTDSRLPRKPSCTLPKKALSDCLGAVKPQLYATQDFIYVSNSLLQEEQP